MEEKMTLFYSKRTGEIKSFCTGIQNMSYFGADEEDYTLIWECIVVDKDDYVLSNRNKFIIENLQIKIKSDQVPQYPIASQ